ncbi:hypothetical protein JYK04_08194 [Streptomyces nojiriensis]|nr:hypothetical protein JYK04_08194 [Streptomyces nojiriensis]
MRVRSQLSRTRQETPTHQVPGPPAYRAQLMLRLFRKLAGDAARRWAGSRLMLPATRKVLGKPFGSWKACGPTAADAAERDDLARRADRNSGGLGFLGAGLKDHRAAATSLLRFSPHLRSRTVRGAPVAPVGLLDEPRARRRRPVGLGRLFRILSAEPAASGAVHGKAEERTVYWTYSGAPTTRPGAVPGVAGPARSGRDGLVQDRLPGGASFQLAGTCSLTSHTPPRHPWNHRHPRQRPTPLGRTRDITPDTGRTRTADTDGGQGERPRRRRTRGRSTGRTTGRTAGRACGPAGGVQPWR